MDTKERLKSGDVAKIAAGPGRTAAQSGSRFNRWCEADIIPRDEHVWGPGGPAYVYPQSTGAVAAILFDLFDAGVVRDKGQLGRMWRFFAGPHEGGPTLIDQTLDAVADSECCWLIMTMWRGAKNGEFQPTCAVRFEQEYDRPVEAPSADHEPIAEYVINLHVLLKRFATRDSNVLPFGEG